jgi:3-(3-hydroxy-phenyl)propionate hydroxylase
VRAGQGAWLLEQLGHGFTLLSFGPARPVHVGGLTAEVLEVGRDIEDVRGVLAQRYDGQPGTVYLIRPDQHVAARWRAFDEGRVREAMRRALKLA